MVWRKIILTLCLVGFGIIIGGCAYIPTDLSTEERINPTTNTYYSLTDQTILYRNKVLASYGFRLIIIGLSVLGTGCMMLLGLYIRSRHSLRENIPPIITVIT